MHITAMHMRHNSLTYLPFSSLFHAAADDLRELTFAPRINGRRGSGSGPGTSGATVLQDDHALPIHDRLFQQAKEKQAAAAAALLAQATSTPVLPALHPVTVRAPRPPGPSGASAQRLPSSAASAAALQAKGGSRRASNEPVSHTLAEVESKLRMLSAKTGSGSPGHQGHIQAQANTGETLSVADAKARSREHIISSKGAAQAVVSPQKMVSLPVAVMGSPGVQGVAKAGPLLEAPAPAVVIAASPSPRQQQPVLPGAVVPVALQFSDAWGAVYSGGRVHAVA
jgi:hypothetical protein